MEVFRFLMGVSPKQIIQTSTMIFFGKPTKTWITHFFLKPPYVHQIHVCFSFSLSHMLHGWNIYLHLPQKRPKGR